MTSIEWTGETWNPVVGCSKVSEGCRNCYAINQAYRNNAMGQSRLKEKRGRLRYYEGLTEKRGDRVEWTGKVVFVPEALDIPRKTCKPTVWFVNSMSDLFHELVTNKQLDQIFAVMALTPQHTYQILTKRPERMLEYMQNSSERIKSEALISFLEGNEDQYTICDRLQFPLPNVWLGVTVENQKAANDRIYSLLETPAAIRFLSCEPLLEEIDFTGIEDSDLLGEIDWVIVGGESGYGARPCEIKWIRSIVKQCKESETPVFVKQLGSHPFIQLIPELGGKIPWTKSTGKGGKISEFPEDLQIREMPINAR